MRRLIVMIVLAVFCGNANAQLVFYSNPEPVHEVSSPDSEQTLYLYPSGLLMAFSKDQPKDQVTNHANPANLWFANLAGGSVFDSLQIQSFNESDKAYTPIGLDPDGSFLFSQVSYYAGTYTGSVWAYDTETEDKNQVEVPFFKNTSQHQSGYITRNGQYMLLSLETPSGYGVEDLYVCERKADGSWSVPKNLGYTINTDKQEVTPFLAEDGKTLYFATNARQGFGSFDLYHATRLDESWRNWTEPVNLGGMINSQGAETSLMYNEGSDYAYFISTQNSDGYGDIKRVRIIPSQITPEESDTVAKPSVPVEQFAKQLVIMAKNANTNELLKFSYSGKKWVDGTSSAVGYQSEVFDSLALGLNEGDSLKVEIRKRGFFPKRVAAMYSALEDSINKLYIMLEPLEVGRTIVLENVLFKRSTAQILDHSIDELSLVVEMMKENPEMKIFLKGHTDNVGNKVLNINLSQKRVNAVKAYLVERGIAADRISGRGFGGSKPIADNRKEQTRKLNRRVEFEIVK